MENHHRIQWPGIKQIVEVEAVVGKFKNFFGEILSCSLFPQFAYSAICAAIIAFNSSPIF
jgi:hypothetical protein